MRKRTPAWSQPSSLCYSPRVFRNAAATSIRSASADVLSASFSALRIRRQGQAEAGIVVAVFRVQRFALGRTRRRRQADVRAAADHTQRPPPGGVSLRGSFGPAPVVSANTATPTHSPVVETTLRLIRPRSGVRRWRRRAKLPNAKTRNKAKYAETAALHNLKKPNASYAKTLNRRRIAPGIYSPTRGIEKH